MFAGRGVWRRNRHETGALRRGAVVRGAGLMGVRNVLRCLASGPPAPRESTGPARPGDFLLVLVLVIVVIAFASGPGTEQRTRLQTRIGAATSPGCTRHPTNKHAGRPSPVDWQRA